MNEASEVVTQIIPVKYASVSQFVPNLELLLPTTATLTANESANSLILVATKTDIKRMLKIISALDTSIASVSSIRVIPLNYADAKDTATMITTLFSAQAGQPEQQQRRGPGNLFSMFGGGGPFGGWRPHRLRRADAAAAAAAAVAAARRRGGRESGGRRG